MNCPKPVDNYTYTTYFFKRPRPPHIRRSLLNSPITSSESCRRTADTYSPHQPPSTSTSPFILPITYNQIQCLSNSKILLNDWNRILSSVMWNWLIRKSCRDWSSCNARLDSWQETSNILDWATPIATLHVVKSSSHSPMRWMLDASKTSLLELDLSSWAVQAVISQSQRILALRQLERVILSRAVKFNSANPTMEGVSLSHGVISDSLWRR